MQTALISHPVCQKHAGNSGHPECPERLRVFEQQLRSSAVVADLKAHLAPIADRHQLERVHDVDYIRTVEEASPKQGLISLDPDTLMNPYSLESTKRGAGAACLGAELVFREEARHAFCAVRPCGHHATRNRAMGFCIFNGVAVGAAHALDDLGLARVAILDFDVHHGNGTEDIFADDPRVLFCSSFQHPFYPYTDPVSHRDHIIKTPLAAGSGGDIFRKSVTDTWLPALEAFAPQMIFISAGFDAHRDDQLGQLQFVEDDYVWFTEKIIEVADRHCPGRIVSILEGGYDLQANAHSAIAHLQALADN
ncbi:histone deacetylase family protein [Sedimenticola hydrogenitrophicus]|uniref:histone deacetylase family protein n=1 Tax=Sedimenticola hydrogenitrophicus TaxID=2967975 RepID=UPI0023AE7CC3|nr:histone deacetylase family protein [Sedimenticola hydrogenitrophicus]